MEGNITHRLKPYPAYKTSAVVWLGKVPTIRHMVHDYPLALDVLDDHDRVPQSEGTLRHHPFRSSTVKQAIQEGVFPDVPTSYTPVKG